MKVVIIAGGKGTRIQSVAEEIPKPMIPIAGKPVIAHQVALAKRYGYTDFIFLTGHLGEQIEKYFGNGAEWGVTINYCREPQPLGTAGAFQLIADQLQEDFWVFYGDTVMDFDMSSMLQFHRQQQGAATLFLHPNDHPYDSDLVAVDDNHRIGAFYPKPHPAGYFRNLVNAAVYILSPKLIPYIPVNEKSDFGNNIFPAALANGELIYGYNSPEYVKDMGTPERYTKTCNDFISGKVARLNKKNKRPAIFLDRDGVINKEVDLLKDPDQLELLPGVTEAIKNINQSGYLAVVVSNQPVIARNLCSIAELRLIHNKLESLLGEERAFLDAIYFCPHHPDKGYPEERAEYKINCLCRKPKPGMLLNAANDLNIDLSLSYMIGDRESDVLAGNNAMVKEAILIPQNQPYALLNIINNILQK